MRVEEGYRPKIKFSVSFFPDTFERLCQYCKKHSMHRSTFIETAVRAALEEGGRFRPAQPAAIRANSEFSSKAPKKQNVRMLARKSKGRSS
jgi:ribosomal protein L44E